jgi:zinc D-Ala-D-Ala carboxypeptidase
LDFITIDGIPDDENPQKFADTEEYEWLAKNANSFKFYLSYPKNNTLGVVFEPWYWSFQTS